MLCSFKHARRFASHGPQVVCQVNSASYGILAEVQSPATHTVAVYYGSV